MSFRKLEKGKDWNLKGEIAYGVAGVHDELVRTASLYADLVGHWQSEPVS